MIIIVTFLIDVQAVRGELSQYVSEVTVTEHLIQWVYEGERERESEREREREIFCPPLRCRHITDTPASEREFLENLHELDHKVNFLNLQVNKAKHTIS